MCVGRGGAACGGVVGGGVGWAGLVLMLPTSRHADGCLSISRPSSSPLTPISKAMSGLAWSAGGS